MFNKWFQTGAIASLLVLVSCTPTPQKGTITITSQIDFSAEPFHGTFEVTEGADVLGCEQGSFVDTQFPATSTVLRDLTCESGERSGTFTLKFTLQNIPGPGDINGLWSVKEATDEFSGLSGGGDFSLVVSEARDSGVDTTTGEIEFTP
jgi:hypothetical protein